MFNRQLFTNLHVAKLFTVIRNGTLLAFALCFSANDFYAQNGAEPALLPDRGTGNRGSYSISDIENISLNNGNVNLSIPLASLPAIAGGKLSWTISAHYNSKIWDVKSDQYPADQHHMQPYTLKYLSAGQGGWTLGGQYAIWQQTSDEEVVTLQCVGQPDCTYASFRYKYFLQTPDGTRHEMRPMDAPTCNGCPSWRNGYFAQTPETSGTAMRYYSFDGSYIWAVVNPPGSSTLWTIYLKDGTKITENSSGIQRIYDTNNNAIKIFTDFDAQQTTTTHYVDEQTGREIKISQASGSNTAQVKYQAVGGTWMTISVNFDSSYVFGYVYNVGDRDCHPVGREHATDFPIIRSIVLPQTEPGQPQRQFTFTYNTDSTNNAVNFSYNPDCTSSPISVASASQGIGELSRIVTPTGAQIDYSYTLDGNPSQLTPVEAASNFARASITQKKITHDGGTIDTWTYAISSVSGSVTSPDGSTVLETFYGHDAAKAGYLAGPNGLSGLVYRSDRSSKIRVERQWGLKIFDGAYSLTPEGSAGFNTVVLAEYTSLMESGSAVKMSAKTFQYDFNGNVTETKEYDWFDPALVSRDSFGVPTGVPGGATLLRTTTNTHYNQAATSASTNVYAKRPVANPAPLILSAPRDTITGPSQTRFSYDNQAWNVVPTLGNLTRVSAWNDQGSVWLDTVNTYDNYGNRLTTIAPKGVATTGDPNDFITTFVWDVATKANITQVTVDPRNGTGTQTSSVVYDFSTGLPTSQTDINGKLTTIDYTNQLLNAPDPFLRTGKVSSPAVNSVVGGVTYTNQRHQARSLYYDQALQLVVESDLNTEADRKLKARTTSDQLGRVTLAESNEDGTANWTISSQTVYVQAGKITKTSNPKRNTAANTDGWTRTTRDNLGRVTEVATFATATQPPDSGTNSNWTGSVSSTYYANETTVQDQAGKQRKSVTDGVGRLLQVYEDPTGLNYQTSYQYDTLNNLRKVTQGAQTRYFMYDSLSRLIRARNPEQNVNAAFNLTDPITGNSQWVMKYTYDENSNLTTKVDARNVTTTYTYDGLNRNTAVSYSDGTPAVNRYYDGAISNGKGRLHYSLSYNLHPVSGYAYSLTQVNGYDAIGRVTGQQQGFLNSAGTQWYYYPVSRTYNLASRTSSQTYPSNRTISNNYDNAGRLSSFSGGIGDGVPRTYADTFSYNAAGMVTKERFGTTTALYHNLHYNNRQQLVENRLGTDSSSTTTWNRGALINYYSNQARTANNQWLKASDNNGNVSRVQHFVPTADVPDPINNYAVPMIDDYDYDALNRITLVTGRQQASSGSGWTSVYGQGYSYDRWGNRTINAGATYGTGINNTVYAVDTATNRLTAMTYDLAGNVITDTGNAREYDAENRMKKAWGGGQWNYYVYDSDGKRVRRVVGSVETWQVYGLEGELIAEYPVNGTAATPQKEYGYRNGQMLIVGGCDLARWIVADHLGTPRMEIDPSGSLATMRRHDYLPFGEELLVGMGNSSIRTAGMGYQADCVRQQFIGKERDTETGADYLYARYYMSVHGRFTSVDPALQQMRSMVNPQNWNGYTYAIDNPLTYVDHNGKWPTAIHNLIIRLAFPGLSQAYIKNIQDGSFSVDFPTTLLESHANEHAMRRPGQTVEQAQQGYQQFINEWSERALKFGPGVNNFSMHYFGNAIHPIMDNTSPAHMPFQLYDAPDLTGIPIIDIILIDNWRRELREHTQTEASISDSQLNGAVTVVRDHFKKVFGKATYDNAVPALFQNATFSIVAGKPIVKAENLGTITVRPDGKQDYKGPLTPHRHPRPNGKSDQW